jgi:hypothetical protein
MTNCIHVYVYMMIYNRWSIIYLMRATTISVTNLPDPNDMCRHGTLENGIATFFSGLSCGDMIFSGHTVALILNPLILHQAFPNMPTYVAVLMWSLMILGMWALLATHMHYLVDIEVAVYISFLTYWGYNSMVNNERYLARYKWLAWWEHDRYYHCTLSDMWKWWLWKWRAVPGSIDPRVGEDPSFEYLRALPIGYDTQTDNNNNTKKDASPSSTSTSSSSRSPTPPSPSVPSPQSIIKSTDDLPTSSSSSDSIVTSPPSSSSSSPSSSRRSKTTKTH